MNQVGCECEGPVIVYLHMCWNVHSGGAGPGPAQADILAGWGGGGAAVGVSVPPHSWRSKQETRDKALDICNMLTLDCV